MGRDEISEWGLFLQDGNGWVWEDDKDDIEQINTGKLKKRSCFKVVETAFLFS